MTEPAEAVVPASWWSKLKAAPDDAYKNCKDFCTSGKLKELAYGSLDAATTLLDIVGPFLPPPANVAASLLSGVCKCVHGEHENSNNLKKLLVRCLDILDLVLYVLNLDGFISTSRSSSDLPKLPDAFTNIMSRFNTFLEEVKTYCESYATKGLWATGSRFLLFLKHKQRYDELASELRGLTADASFALNVDHKRALKEINEKLNAGMPSVMDEELKKYLAGLKVTGYSELICQPHLEALWSNHFMHEQAVRWGLWWAVFPGKLTINDTLDEAAQKKLVDLLVNKDSKDAFRRAVELEDTIFISIDELCLSFPDDSPLLPTVQALLCKGIDLMCEDKDRTELAMAEAGRGQKKLEEKLTSMEAELKKEMSLSNFSQHIHQNNMQKLWSVYFKHEQAVRWGLWWAVFPAKLEGLPATSKNELVDLLASPEAQAAFKRAVEVEDSLFLSIDELRRSFPADQPLLERVKTLLKPPPPPPRGQKLPVRVRPSRAISPDRLQRVPPGSSVRPQRPQSARQLPFRRSQVMHEVHGVAGPTRVPSEPFLGQRVSPAPHQRQPAEASAAYLPAPLRTHSFQGYTAPLSHLGPGCYSTVNGPARSCIPSSHDQTMTVSPEHNAGYDWLIVVGILGAFCFGFGTGANDLGNSFGTSVGTRTLTMGQAIALAAAAEFTGAMLLGHTSTNTIAGGIADIDAYTSYPEVFAYGMMVSLIVSGCWQITASYYELNVSSTHSIIGCIIGFSLVFDGNNAVLWSQPDPKSPLRFKGVVPIVASWFISPLLTGLASAALFLLFRTLVLRRQSAHMWALWMLPPFMVLTASICIYFVLTKGAGATLGSMGWTTVQCLWVSIVAGAGLGLLTAVMAVPLLLRQANKQFATMSEAPVAYLDGDPSLRKAVDLESWAGPASLPGQAAVADMPEPSVRTRDRIERVSRVFKGPVMLVEGHEVAEVPDGLQAMAEEGEAPCPGLAGGSNDSLVRSSSHHHPVTARGGMPRGCMLQLQTLWSSHCVPRITRLHRRVQNLLTFAAYGSRVDIHTVLEEDEAVRAIHDQAELFDPRAEYTFQYLQVFAAVCVSFAHGAADSGYIAGPLATIWEVVDTGKLTVTVAVPVWVVLVAALGLVAGLAMFGYPTTRSMGVKLCKLTPTRGMCAEISTAFVIMVAGQYKLPTSSSHCITGAIMGVGLVEGWHGVNWKFFTRQFLSWVLTPLATMAPTALIFAQAVFAPGVPEAREKRTIEATMAQTTLAMLENYRSSMLQYQEASRLGLLPSLPYTDMVQRNASLISLGRTINASIKPGSARVSFDRRMEWFYAALSMYQSDTVLTVGQTRVRPGASICSSNSTQQLMMGVLQPCPQPMLLPAGVNVSWPPAVSSQPPTKQP